MVKSTHHTPNDHLAYLDGWRGVAILLVMVGHFSGITLVGFGAFGVDLFFVLSGRLMADILVKQRAPLGGFAQRRIARIWPVAAVFSTALLLLTPIVPFVDRWAVNLEFWFRGVFFLADNENLLGDMPHTMAHLWSLGVEAQSYIVLAVIVAFCRRWLPNGIVFLSLLVAIAAMAWGLWLAWSQGAGGHDLYWRVEVRLASIVGAFAGYLVLRELKFASWVAPLALMSAMALHMTALPEWPAYSVGTILLILAVNSVDQCQGLLMRILNSKPLGWLGLISYSLYVWHGPFYMWQWTFGAVPMLLVSLAVAVASYFLLEGPSRRFMNSMSWPRFWLRGIRA